MKFGIVIVIYHSFERIVNYIKNEIPKLGPDCVSVIVDNDAFLEDSRKVADACHAVLCNAKQKISNKDAKVFLINSRENLGYARGNNLGTDFLTNNFNLDYLVFSNDDIVIKSNNILSIMAEKLQKNPDCKIIGPKMINLKNIAQLPHMKSISIYRQIGWNLFPFLRQKNKTENKASVFFEDKFCYWVSGAFMMVDAKAFAECGKFDEKTFLYYEEAILSERFLTKGYKVLWTPEAMVLHEEAASTPSRAFAKKELLKSSCYYYRHYMHNSHFIILCYLFATWLKKMYNRFNI